MYSDSRRYIFERTHGATYAARFRGTRCGTNFGAHTGFLIWTAVAFHGATPNPSWRPDVKYSVAGAPLARRESAGAARLSCCCFSRFDR
jgi:hypothetical protein